MNQPIDWITVAKVDVEKTYYTVRQALEELSNTLTVFEQIERDLSE
jgi:hypothetical protein